MRNLVFAAPVSRVFQEVVGAAGAEVGGVVRDAFAVELRPVPLAQRQQLLEVERPRLMNAVQPFEAIDRRFATPAPLMQQALGDRQLRAGAAGDFRRR